LFLPTHGLFSRWLKPDGTLSLMPSLHQLPLTFRALFSSFLVLIGIGYLMALFYMFLVDVDPHQKMGMGLIGGIEMNYHGDGAGRRLEAALRGVMADKLSPDERDRLLHWVRDGALEADFDAVKPTFDKNCVACHNPSSGLQIPSLATFQDVQKLTQVDTGQSILQLARVSHIHLFGISLIFLLTGAIFSLSETPAWLRVSLVVIPYVAILADIASWWFTKFIPVFGFVVVIGGAIWGLTLAGQILISLWEMWLPIPWSGAAASAVKQ
jgi:hypothetical protein